MKGICVTLSLIFMTLKLMGYIDWSWWIVFLPIWGALVVALAVCALMLLVACAVAYFENKS